MHPDFDLNLMRMDQNLYTLTAEIIVGLKDVMEGFRPDYVYVHGDTTTTVASSIAAFYSGAKIFHVEAGLRTQNKRSPFPEELNRQLTGRMADFHFAPTEAARKNLLLENINDDSIIVTGNTVIDALFYSAKEVEYVDDQEIMSLKNFLDHSKKNNPCDSSPTRKPWTRFYQYLRGFKGNS